MVDWPSIAGDDDALGPGERVDHYRILRLLGRGGMGEVYLARDGRLGRKVALKLVRRESLGSSPEALQRFLFEAGTTARFNHPHIVTVYAVGELRGGPYVALEYLEGQTLRERLDRDRPGVPEALRMTLAIAEALAEAHANKVLHRDLKPQNVIIGRDGRLRVLDFGLAKIVEPPAAKASAQDGAAAGARAVGEHPALQVTLGAQSATLERTTASGLGDTVLALEETQAPGSKEALVAALADQSLWSADSEGRFDSDGGIAGTPAYMAPEQWQGDAPSEGTDVWALGVLLFEMLAARRQLRPWRSAARSQRRASSSTPRACPRISPI